LSGNLNAKHKAKRLGRGIGSGKGKTSGKGVKGQTKRSGKGKIRARFEGGQKPLTVRIPKLGFTNNFDKEYNIVNLSALGKFKAGSVVNEQALIEKGLFSKPAPYGLKLLGNGEITAAITIQCKKATEGALKKVKKVGGKVEIV